MRITVTLSLIVRYRPAWVAYDASTRLFGVDISEQDAVASHAVDKAVARVCQLCSEVPSLADAEINFTEAVK